MKNTVAWLAVSAFMTAPAMASQTAVTKTGEAVTVTATIQAIDHTARTIILRAEDGTEDSLWVPPEVKRFGELKVGDKVKTRYYESYVFQVRKPGETSNPVGQSAERTIGTGANPAATLSRQLTATVEVVAVNMAASSITIKTADGHTVTRRIENAKNLEGIKAGDKIDITYTQAAMVSVEPAK